MEERILHLENILKLAQSHIADLEDRLSRVEDHLGIESDEEYDEES